ncbi:MAG: AraC family transcriptional regulator [Bacteroides sp.]|nr:AraC family transcriptional regulator [Bacteroides sp.]
MKATKDLGLNYNIELPENVTNILKRDFWVLEKFDRSMIPILSDPLKFTSNVSIIVKRGTCNVDINLISYQVQAPCIVNIRSSQILQLNSVSDDFDSSFIVMSNKFCDKLFLLLQDCRVYPTASGNQIVKIPPSLLTDFINFYQHINRIFEDTNNPYAYQAMVLAISSFFLETGYKCYMYLMEDYPYGNRRIVDKFMILVQQNFKNERFLEFYANQLQITPKHLSRTIKALTGFTAVEWIERFVVLEAKVLLKSTNLNIQQIADELNFHSQSFFGKYFKKKVGMSPKEFRNF